MKRKDSRYEVGKRCKSWPKVINCQYGNVLITGLRKKEFGLLLRFIDDKHGIMEFMPPTERKRLYKLQKIFSEDDKFQFIESIKRRVKYRNLTKKVYLCIPSFVKWNYYI